MRKIIGWTGLSTLDRQTRKLWIQNQELGFLRLSIIFQSHSGNSWKNSGAKLYQSFFFPCPSWEAWGDEIWCMSICPFFIQPSQAMHPNLDTDPQSHKIIGYHWLYKLFLWKQKIRSYQTLPLSHNSCWIFI